MKKVIITFVFLIACLGMWFFYDYSNSKVIEKNKTLTEEINETKEKNKDLVRNQTQLQNKNKRLELDIKDLEIKIEVLQKRIDGYKKSIVKYLDLISDLNKEISSLKTSSIKRTKRLFYKSDEITGGKSYVSDHEKTKLTLKIKQALKNKKINEIIVIEGNSDTIKFIKDKKNRKNISLAFKRAIDNVLYNLSEDELNSIYLKANTKANERNIKVYIM